MTESVLFRLVVGSTKLYCNDDFDEYSCKINFSLKTAKFQREFICRQILTENMILQLPMTKHNNANLPFQCNKLLSEKHEAKLFRILSFDLFVHSEKLIKIWSFLKQHKSYLNESNNNDPQKYLTFYQSYHRFSVLLLVVSMNPFLSRYIFKHSKLWKPLLFFHLQLMDHKFHYNTIYTKPFQMQSYLTHFRMKHVKYLIRRNFHTHVITMIKNILITNQEKIHALFKKVTVKNREVALEKLFTSEMYSRYIDVFFAGSVAFIRSIYKVSMERDHLVTFKKFDQALHLKFNSMIQDITDGKGKYSHKASKILFAKVIYRFMRQLALFRFMSSINKSCLNLCDPLFFMECGWIRCINNTAMSNVTLKLCKGCKLVAYCCRKHQKKAWKAIHSQQCLRITN
eukprot:76590_1